MDKKVYREFYLDNLGCATCAEKMEAGICKIDGVSESSVNFINKKMKIEMEANREAAIMKEARSLIRSIEPDVVIRSEMESEKNVEEDSEADLRVEKIKLILSILFLGGGILLGSESNGQLLCFVLAYVLSASEVMEMALHNILRGEVFDENFLMMIASIGAMAIGEYGEAVAVMVFYSVGEYFQDRAVDNSRKSIAELMNIHPERAYVVTEKGVVEMPPERVQVGDVVQVRPGERIPLDGTLLEGETSIDTSALTGESVPRFVVPGEEVLSGSINQRALIRVRVDRPFSESTVAGILKLVEEAAEKKAPTEKFITKFAKIYTPAVVLGAALLALVPPLITGDPFSVWVYRALIFLVASCPCALVISVPLGYFAGIGGASKEGVLIKGGHYIDAMKDVKTVVFDKTGTLTKGQFGLGRIHSAGNWTEEELLRYGAIAEKNSNHPMAKSVIRGYAGSLEDVVYDSFEELPGRGVRALVAGEEILAGNDKLMKEKGISHLSTEEGESVIHVAVNGVYGGYLVFEDEVKEDSAETIRQLKERGYRTVMLTGDKEGVAQRVATLLKVDEYYGELLPGDKVRKVEELRAKSPVIFVGDGINDAPVLATAEVGVAMGGLGSDAAIEAADVVIMRDEPSKVLRMLGIAEKTRSIVMENVVFALGIKGVVLLLGALGMVNMWAAVFADVGVALIAIVNSLRALKTR